MSESTLVALCALQHFNRSLIDEPRMWSLVKSKKLPREFENRDAIREMFEKAIENHEKIFREWSPRETDLETIKNLSSGIRVI